MNKIKAHVAISLDGYIAHTDGDTSWIPGELVKEISEIHQTAEILLAGSITYNAIYEQSAGNWPYKNTYIVSHYDSSALSNENFRFIFDDPIESIEEMKKTATSDIMVIGGGNLITSLINNKLLDELNLYIVPVLLGDGIQLLGKTFSINVKCINSEQYKGTTKITYSFY